MKKPIAVKVAERITRISGAWPSKEWFAELWLIMNSIPHDSVRQAHLAVWSEVCARLNIHPEYGHIAERANMFAQPDKVKPQRECNPYLNGSPSTPRKQMAARRALASGLLRNPFLDNEGKVTMRAITAGDPATDMPPLKPLAEADLRELSRSVKAWVAEESAQHERDPEEYIANLPSKPEAGPNAKSRPITATDPITEIHCSHVPASPDVMQDKPRPLTPAELAAWRLMHEE
jgi:hypothetical protein